LGTKADFGLAIEGIEFYELNKDNNKSFEFEWEEVGQGCSMLIK
jgi:hypothetical protein